jgi:hypothetical protein
MKAVLNIPKLHVSVKVIWFTRQRNIHLSQITLWKYCNLL